MNDVMMKIDNYLVSLGEYGFEETDMIFLLQTYINRVRGRIHIINFSRANIVKIVEAIGVKWNETKFIDRDRFNKCIFIVDNLSCSFEWVYSYIKSLSGDDYVFIIGAERLLPYSETKNIINTEFNGLTINAKMMQDADWKTFCFNLDNLYYDFQDKVQGIIVNIGVDHNTREIILSELEKSDNMSIAGLVNIENNENRNIIINTFYDKLNDSSYDELVQFLNSKKDKLSDKDYIIMLVQLYLKFGIANKAINLLSENYSMLSNKEKKLLADLLSREKNKNEDCKKILEEIFEDDKYLDDLMPSILRAYEKESDDIKVKWITIALEIDPENPKVLEHYANWLSNKKRYKEASMVFRKLKYQLKNQYYEIVARINDILDNPLEDSLDVERYVLQAVQDYPELHNEAILRLVIYFKDFVKSEYITYKLLNRIDYKYDEKLIYQLLNIKLEMLKDVVVASKALGKLKPNSKENHAEKINVERIKCLIKSIVTLAKYNKGYLDWRRFIDDCQSNKGWRDSVYGELIMYLDKLNKLDIKSIKNNSFISKVENCTEDNKAYLCIKLLRKIRTGEFHEEDVDSIIIGVLKYAEIINDEDIKLWGRYYASIIYSLRGGEQDANNYAISIFEYYNRVSPEKRDLCILLGLMAWANSQFRIGREIEGIICVMSCIVHIENIDEIYPILEEGLNIIGRFFSDNSEIIKSKDKVHICSALSRLSIYNKSLEFVASFISNSLDELIDRLNKKIHNYGQKDIEWAGNLTNLIGAYIKRKEKEKAANLIIENYNELIEAYKARMDLRYKAVTNWAEILFFTKTPNKQNYEIIINLIKVAINDIENKRNIFHKGERAVIGDISKKIYRMYIEVVTLMANIPEVKTITEEEYIKEIEKCVNMLSLRSVIEQKKYNMNKTVDKVTFDKEREYLTLVEEYNILYKKTEGESIYLNDMGFKIEELLNYLKLNHPHYKALPNAGEIGFNEIKKSLKDKELFYQYMKLNIMNIEIIITNSIVNIRYQLIDSEELEANLKNLNEGVYKDNVDIEENIRIISKYFGKELIEYSKEHEVERIYVMPDLSLGVYNLNMCNYDGEFLMDKVKSIINILDYDVIKTERYSLHCDKIANRIFGNERDYNLKLINDFLENNIDEKFYVIENMDDSIDTLTKYINEKNVNSVFLYGHGINDPNGECLGGALGIQGKRELIRINNIIEQMSIVQNIVLISCRGGVPLNSDLESSTGSWAELFEAFNGNIVICRWDVNTKASIFIMEKMINYIRQYKLRLDEALTLSIRDARDKYGNSVYWAGIEFWMN